MKDIKVKVHDKSPKIRNPASRIPKEFVRSAVLEAKEKSRELPDRARKDIGQESPTEYAANKMESAEQRIGSESASAAYRAGKKMAVKTREKISERKQTQRAAQEAKEAATEGVHGSAKQMSPSASRVEKLKGNRRDSRMQSRIKLKPESKDLVREAQKKTVRTAPRVVKVSPRASGKVKTQNAIQKRQAVKAAKAAKQAAVKSAQAARQSAKAAKTTAKGLKAIAEAAASTVKAIFAAVMAGGGAVLVLLIVIVGIIGGAAFMGSSQSAEPLSAEVLAYTPTIQRYASEFGIPEYVPVIQAIMMQESGGLGTDPMQSSECPYNTQYPNSPGAIQDPEYSIKVGIQYYADCIREAGCESPQDMDKLKLSLQGYNYGNGYITWAIRNYGGYSEANALQFSQEQAAAHGWSRYGDPEYVPHVLRYYSGGGLFAGLFGNGQIVSIAKAQLGNEGGQKFWSWYGFSGRVEWCACFVSWCAEQCGYIDSGVIPKFSLCSDGVEWFSSKGQFRDGSYVPARGNIIFFDWGNNGSIDHVGIVESVTDGVVNTVEGNSGDAVKRQSYVIGNSEIHGYGVPIY